jgi:hypothetical protein
MKEEVTDEKFYYTPGSVNPLGDYWADIYIGLFNTQAE